VVVDDDSLRRLVGKGSQEASEASDEGDIAHTSVEEGIVTGDKHIGIVAGNGLASVTVGGTVPSGYFGGPARVTDEAAWPFAAESLDPKRSASDLARAEGKAVGVGMDGGKILVVPHIVIPGVTGMIVKSAKTVTRMMVAVVVPGGFVAVVVVMRRMSVLVILVSSQHSVHSQFRLHSGFLDFL